MGKLRITKVAVVCICPSLGRVEKEAITNSFFFKKSQSTTKGSLDVDIDENGRQRRVLHFLSLNCIEPLLHHRNRHPHTHSHRPCGNKAQTTMRSTVSIVTENISYYIKILYSELHTIILNYTEQGFVAISQLMHDFQLACSKTTWMKAEDDRMYQRYLQNQQGKLNRLRLLHPLPLLSSTRSK